MDYTLLPLRSPGFLHVGSEVWWMLPVGFLGALQFSCSTVVKPSIIQINLATCCVVPPALQEFTKDHNVQLLTHSDPFGKCTGISSWLRWVWSGV
ncbi:hypothetical protein PR048_029412 [Dryococelus australis]|uniref:Uncharacterized protein n=1 Tax=Dryococelus australis TaxID=614101 RepID=A0ABQ9GG80_9NEOP|nr:hypothetical protein PR048_029412 [Dryococelus australis]